MTVARPTLSIELLTIGVEVYTDPIPRIVGPASRSRRLAKKGAPSDVE